MLSKCDWRKIARVLGAALMMLGLAFVAYQLYVHWSTLTQLVVKPIFVVSLIGLSAVYTLVQCLLALAWGRLVGGISGLDLAPGLTISVYGRAQIAKYLPGNVFQYAGRNLLTVELGWPQSAVTLASFLETVLIAAAAATAAFVFAMISSVEIDGFGAIWLWQLAAVVALIALWLLIKRLPGMTVVSRWFDGDSIRSMSRASVLGLPLIYYLAFLGLSALSVCVLAATINPSINLSEVYLIAFAVSLGWLLGYVTLGAPGGLGVREATMTLILGPVVGAPDALAIAIAFRLMTTISDLAWFLSASLLRSKSAV